MHTDEYEISLARELAVCERYVRASREFLRRMEARHGMSTDELLARRRTVSLPAGVLRDWRDAHEMHRRWSTTRDEYRALLGGMKQSAPE